MMEKIFNWLGNIPADKALHFIAGMLIVAVMTTLYPAIADYAFLASVLAGFIKEVYDLFTDGHFDFVDFAATLLGGLVIQVLIWYSL